MKKVLILFIVLVALSNLVFADFALGAFGRTQFNLAEGVNGNSDITQSWGPDWSGAGGPRFGIDFIFTSKFLDYKMNLRTDSATITSIPTLYGTLKLLPDMLSLHLGEFAGDGWDTFRKTSPHPIHDVSNGNVGRFGSYGIIAAFAPKDTGFEAAVMWGTNNFAAANTIMQNLRLTDIAAAYTIPNMLKITAGSTADGDPATLGDRRNIFGRVELLMVKDLTLWLDAKYAGMETYAAVLNTTIDAELAAGYTMDKLSIAFAGTFGMSTVKATSTSTTTWGAYPEVYYNLGALTIGLFAGISGSSATGTAMVIEVEPYVLINDFNLRISFDYTSNPDGLSATSDYAWKIPVIVTFGF